MKAILVVLGSAIGYFLLGFLGLQLAIPPGFSSPVWPAAGFGIAVAHHWGRKGLLGAFVGHFAINLMLGQFNLQGVVVALSIACGGGVQHLVGAALLRRCRAVETPRQVLRYGLGMPFVCIISASVGVVALFASGAITAELVVQNWVHWWVGDTFGALLFTAAFSSWWVSDVVARNRRLPLTVLAVAASGLGVLAAHVEAVNDWQRMVVNLLAFTTIMLAALLASGYMGMHARIIAQDRDLAQSNIGKLDELIKTLERK